MLKEAKEKKTTLPTEKQRLKLHLSGVKCLKNWEKKYQSRILYPVKISLKSEKGKGFSDKIFVASRTVIQ
jgi:hypothetical protein